MAQDAMMDHGIIGITRHEENLDAWTQCGNFLRNDASGHLGHHDVSQQHMNRPIITHACCQGSLAILCLQTRRNPADSDAL